MKQSKPNWKKKYEETAGLLKLARDGNELLQAQKQSAENLLHLWKQSELHEKIVEKEVLPWYVLPIVIGGWGCLMAQVCWMTFHIHKLQTPILSPYAVYIAKYVPPDPYALDVCKDAWRADERELRKLRRNQKEN